MNLITPFRACGSEASLITLIDDSAMQDVSSGREVEVVGWVLFETEGLKGGEGVDDCEDGLGDDGFERVGRRGYHIVDRGCYAGDGCLRSSRGGYGASEGVCDGFLDGVRRMHRAAERILTGTASCAIDNLLNCWIALRMGAAIVLEAMGGGAVEARTVNAARRSDRERLRLEKNLALAFHPPIAFHSAPSPTTTLPPTH